MSDQRSATRTVFFPSGRGFTLIEVLVVTAVIALLMAILLPAMSRSRQIAIQAVCASGLRQAGIAVQSYAADNRGSIPYGPKSPPPSATNFYPLTGNVTSLISLESGAPIGLGLLLASKLPANPPKPAPYLAREKKVLFCPGADQPLDTESSLATVGISQVEASYYYRHASVAVMSGTLPPPRMKLDRLGNNSRGAPIRCLAADTQFLSPPMMATFFKLKTRTHHQQRMVNALYTDGHVSAHANTGDRYLVNVSIAVYDSLKRILSVLESLDAG